MRRSSPALAFVCLVAPLGCGCGPAHADSLAVAAPAAKAVVVLHPRPPAATPTPTLADRLAGGEVSPEPAASDPLFFAGAERVSVEDLVHALAQVAAELAQSEVVEQEYREFLAEHDMGEDVVSLTTYAKVRLAFEATRDGGLWGLRWDITNRKPRSDEIWAQWAALGDRELEQERWTETAVAECDELSALFAFVARRLGVSDIGLFWPTGNHTVAVWTVGADSDRPVRLVVPTSQVFLSPEATLGTREFNPRSQKTIFEYRRHDVDMDFEIPASLARHFVQTARRYAARPAHELQQRRNRNGGS